MQYSTETLHAHNYHQVLRISSGVALLVDESRRQPMFGALTAFIPSGLAHRSVVPGSPVAYKSLYLSRNLLPHSGNDIILFFISPLGSALFDKIHIGTPRDLSRNLNRECLNLFLKILPLDMEKQANLARLPEPSTALGRDVAGFVKKRYAEPLTMADFTNALPYSGRHLSRLFKADVNVTVFEYLRLYRILTASIALWDPERTVTEIALDCGYESLSSFYRDFSILCGIPPGSFRKTFQR